MRLTSYKMPRTLATLFGIVWTFLVGLGCGGMIGEEPSWSDQSNHQSISSQKPFWLTCNSKECPVYYAHDLNKSVDPAKMVGTISSPTKIGVFVRSGENKMVVSYTMGDTSNDLDPYGNPFSNRNGKVQVVYFDGSYPDDSSKGTGNYSWTVSDEAMDENGTDSGAIEIIYCQKPDGCAVMVSQNDLSQESTQMISCDYKPCPAGMEAQGKKQWAGCGEARKVFVKDSTPGIEKYVVSYPMWDRDGSVQVAPMNEWNSQKPVCPGSGKIERDGSYYIYLPPNYDGGGTFPVLYLIHGLFSNGLESDARHFLNLGLESVMNQGINSGAFPAAIVVLPVLDYNKYRNTSGGLDSYEGLLLQLVKDIDARYRTIPGRGTRAIGGISRGGVWSLEIGFRNSDVFGIVGGHSPALSVNLAPAVYRPENLVPTVGCGGFQKIWLDAGAQDWTLGGTQNLYNILKTRLDTDTAANQQRYSLEFNTYQGSHDNNLWSAHLADYLAFYTKGFWQ